MFSFFTHDLPKKLRYAASFLRRRLVHVNLQILYDCDYHCRICDFWKPEFRRRPRLSAADAAVIGEKLDRLGPQIVSIGGGEPLLHPELEGIVRALARRHFPVMITNGSRMTAETARALFAAGMAEISVSLDYADAAKHDAQRGAPAAFIRGLEALRLLQANRTHPEQRVNLISVIMDDNLAELEPLLEQGAALGVTCLVTLYSHRRGAKPARAAAEDASRRLLALKRQHRHFVALRGYLERFTEAVHRGGVGPCYAGRNLCNIDSQGNVSRCIDRLAEPVGNLLREDPLEVWQRLRRQQREQPCRDCWTSCRGSIETLMYGPRLLPNLLDYWRMTRPVALNGAS